MANVMNAYKQDYNYNKSIVNLFKEINTKAVFNQIDARINNEIRELKALKNAINSEFAKIELEKKYSYHHLQYAYYGMDFAIEFCNEWFVPTTKLDKLYLEKLYIYANTYNRIYELQNINDSELLKSLKSQTDEHAKDQVAKNIKSIYIDRVVSLAKLGKFDEAIDEIVSVTGLLLPKKIKEYK